MAKRKRVRAPFKPAIEGATAKDKGVVVSLARARWKLHHGLPSASVLRMIRFVWMRHPFPWTERNGLHAGVLGACLRNGFLERSDATLQATRAGKDMLENDRRAS